MTDSPPMFEYFIADGETPAKYDLMTLLQGLGGGAVVTAVLAYFAKRGESKDTKQDKAGERAAAFEIKQLEIKTTEREQMLEIMKQDKARALEAEAAIRKEMLQTRRTFGHEIRGIQQHLYNMSEFYHHLYTAATLLAQQGRIMRARLKKNAEKNGETFDEDEFPSVALDQFDPKLLPKFVPSDYDESKIQGRVEILMTHPDSAKPPQSHSGLEG